MNSAHGIRQPGGHAAAWLSLAPGLALLGAVLLLFRDTAAAMVGIWSSSQTFTHAFLVPPIVLWLVWRQKDALALMTPRPAPGVLLPMAAVCALWLLAEMANVNAATQFALVTLLLLSVPAVFGWAVARALTFPLLFSYFAVPVGEFLVPLLMEWTADFTVAALQATGVPVFREGLQFVIPSGAWSVVQACSGVRYLIASFMVGTLFAYLNYRSWQRRAVFMVLSLLVPIVANWLRAYLIVMLGHLSNNQLAAGVDHLIYGWVFFGIVIGAMFFVGARWAEPEAPLPVRSDSTGPAAAPGPAPAWGVGLGALLLLLGTQAVLWQLVQPASTQAPQLALPAPSAPGWAAADQPITAWRPEYAAASVEAAAGYRSAKGSVWLRTVYYRDQDERRKLVTSSNALVAQTVESAWQQVASGSTVVATPAGPLRFRTATLRGSHDPGNLSAQRLRVWQLYWIGGRWTSSDAEARLAVAVHRLLGRGDDSAALFVTTPLLGDTGAADADALLARFVADHAAALSERLEAARGPQ